MIILAIAAVTQSGSRCSTAACCQKHPRSHGCSTSGVSHKKGAAAGGKAGTAVGSLDSLYASCQKLDVGPQPVSELELQQGAKLVRMGQRWIKAFDRDVVEAAYYRRFERMRAQFGIAFAEQPVLSVGARLGGEVRALTRLGALAIGVDFNPGFRNPHVLWGDGASLQFANRTFGFVYTNVLDHVPGALIPRFLSEARRVLKLGGLFLLDMDSHKADAYAHVSLSHLDVPQRLAANGFEVTRSTPFCKSESELSAATSSGACVLGNPTADGTIDPAGGVAFVARRLG